MSSVPVVVPTVITTDDEAPSGPQDAPLPAPPSDLGSVGAEAALGMQALDLAILKSDNRKLLAYADELSMAAIGLQATITSLRVELAEIKNEKRVADVAASINGKVKA